VEDYFDLPEGDGELPYRPAANTLETLRICADAKDGVDISCASDELWWEEHALNHGPGGGHCDNRSGSEGRIGGEWVSPDYHTCSKVLATDCPVLAGGVAPTRAAAANPGAYDGRRVRCFYNVKQLGESCEASTEFTARRKEGDHTLQLNDEWFSPDVMNTLCASRADPKTCPKHPIGTFPSDTSGPVCSEMIACPLCKAWALSKWPGAATQSDTMMQLWCESHPNDPSCRCIRRNDDPLYQKLISTPQLVLPAKAGCWWKGCADKQIQYDLVQSGDRSYEGCPTVYCANIINQSGGELDLGNVDMSINCQPGGDSDPTVCIPECGSHGRCVGNSCLCDSGWTGPTCDTEKDDDKPEDDDTKRNAIIIAGALAAAALSIGFVVVALKKSKSK
jgi:hypothetical protein